MSDEGRARLAHVVSQGSLPTVWRMDLRLRPAVVELVVHDMAATLAFYRRLGVAVPP